ncbi:MAG: cytochrome b/b6 domain-containing protein [Chloroflexota bacterium]
MAKESLPTRYHPVHVVLHWLVAIMVIGAFAIGMTFLDSTPNSAPEKVTYLQYHSVWGSILLLLLVARLVTRFVFNRPAPADVGSPVLNIIAKATHFLLYAGVFLMLFSGGSMSMQAGLMNVFAGQGSLPEDFHIYAVRTLHGMTFSLLFLLILLHFGAALYHQFIRKDKLLARMWFGNK